MKTLLPLLALLAGCAGPSPERLRQQASNTPTEELCYIRVASKFSSNVRMAAFRELQSRGEDCKDQWQYVQARMQSDANKVAADADFQRRSNDAARLMLQKTQVNPPVTCMAINMGGGFTQVQCN